ncbi:hypothetical protein Hamer_G030478 [Homarus americanus]|uniref:Uncharacterized protein n=1 Tax=Homarus americanus TaxID=6706 RepID=A0A8J5KFN6_HOMAM|nr:hypothetical protein Hamer_G030478 [Homarus americanus]
MAHAAHGDWLQHLAPFQHRLLPHLWMATIRPLEHAHQTTMNPIRVDRGSCSVTTRTIRSVYKIYLLLENSIATIPFLLQFYRVVKLYESLIIFVSQMRRGQLDEIEDQARAFAEPVYNDNKKEKTFLG